MPARDLKVLCIHGVGHQEQHERHRLPWIDAITSSVGAWDPGRTVAVEFVPYDDLFEEASLDRKTVAEAFARLAGSALIHGVGDLLRRRGLFDLPERLRWTAGMVAQWAASEELRRSVRERVREWIGKISPHVVCAHSLGSLIAYDLFRREAASAGGIWWITLGSQIGHPAVRRILGGRIMPVQARRWFHLLNPHDDAFTAAIRIQDPSFEQIPAPFDVSGMADHDAAEYLRHPNTTAVAWRAIATDDKPPRALAATRRAARDLSARPARRALLVGINDYARESERLEGCVNDVYRMSEVLQDLGFPGQDVRVLLNERATRTGILERLEWLLDGAGPNDVRLFYYSGHGAQIPSYGDTGEVDYLDECLVPVDFGWSEDSSVTDNAFHEMYTQLPYDTHFLAVLDCCHSGGMTRDAGVRVRGLSPPDDVRHRMLRWDGERGMWTGRDLPLAGRGLLAREEVKEKEKKVRELFLGRAAATRRLGRAVPLWGPEEQFRAAKQAFEHNGPYMPILYQACSEQEYAYEYRHGATPYGAFTYGLTTILRARRAAGAVLSFQQLLDETIQWLKGLELQQTPTVVGPSFKLSQPIPFGPVAPAKRPPGPGADHEARRRPPRRR